MAFPIPSDRLNLTEKKESKMNKIAPAAFAALLFLAFFASPLAASCTEADIHNAIAQWANVPPSDVTDATQLDGLGGKSWPEDAPSLVLEIEQMCGCTIPGSTYETFEIVEDIDDWLGVEDLPEKD